MDNKFNKVAYDAAYVKEHYARISLTVPKDLKEPLKAHAEQHDGGSVNAFINRAILEQMVRDRQDLKT